MVSELSWLVFSLSCPFAISDVVSELAFPALLGFVNSGLVSPLFPLISSSLEFWEDSVPELLPVFSESAVPFVLEAMPPELSALESEPIASDSPESKPLLPELWVPKSSLFEASLPMDFPSETPVELSLDSSPSISPMI